MSHQIPTVARRTLDLVRDAATDGCPTFDVLSPIEGERVASIPDAGEADAERAAAGAVRAFPGWRATPARARAAILNRWANLIDEVQDDLAVLIVAEMGKPVREARAEVSYASDFARTHAIDVLRSDGLLLPGRHADQRIEVSYQPVGPAVGITPWNFPAAMVTRTAAPALAAGCTMVLKPAEQTPLTALVLGQLWQDAGGPPETLTVLTCLRPRDVVRRLLATPGIRKLTFTGSQAVGAELYQEAAKRMMRVSMELGGNAPFLVFADADIEAAADEVMRSKFRISGQTCVCVNRVLVDERISAELAACLEQRVSALRIGDPRESATDVGPLVNQAGLDKVVAHVQDAVEQGAQVRAGGGPAGGLVYAPTLLTGVHDEMLVTQQETFGPVLPVATFTSEEEALQRANATPFGLAAYVWTRDLGRAHRVAERLEAGIVGVNDGVPGGDASVPFGGVKESGVGRAGGRWGLQAYLEPQYRSIRLP
jgi:succinate-semialdehyde dehydrogenase/glutarate-semialdehyde dehydrogenase